MIEILFKLICSHAIADFCLQTDFIAKNKDRHQAIPGMWPYVLSAHSLTHGFGVYLATGNVYLGISEYAAHWLIDFVKCEKAYGIHVDQALHLGCKLAWLFFSIKLLP